MQPANPRDIRAAFEWSRLTDEDSHIAARIGRAVMGRWAAYRASDARDAEHMQSLRASFEARLKLRARFPGRIGGN